MRHRAGSGQDSGPETSMGEVEVPRRVANYSRRCHSIDIMLEHAHTHSRTHTHTHTEREKASERARERESEREKTSCATTRSKAFVVACQSELNLRQSASWLHGYIHDILIKSPCSCPSLLGRGRLGWMGRFPGRSLGLCAPACAHLWPLGGGRHAPGCPTQEAAGPQARSQQGRSARRRTAGSAVAPPRETRLQQHQQMHLPPWTRSRSKHLRRVASTLA